MCLWYISLFYSWRNNNYIKIILIARNRSKELKQRTERELKKTQQQNILKERVYKEGLRETTILVCNMYYSYSSSCNHNHNHDNW